MEQGHQGMPYACMCTNRAPPHALLPIPSLPVLAHLLGAFLSLPIVPLELHRLPPVECGTKQTKHLMYFRSCLALSQEDGAPSLSEMSTCIHSTPPERDTVYQGESVASWWWLVASGSNTPIFLFLKIKLCILEWIPGGFLCVYYHSNGKASVYWLWAHWLTDNQWKKRG